MQSSPNFTITAPNLTATAAPGITVTAQDLARLQDLLSMEGTAAVEQLDAELERARVVAQTEIERDVITMNSEVCFEDLGSGVQRTIRLVYPPDADAERGWISVLAPLGSALLGLRPGQEIEWRVPAGMRRIRVIAVPYQPEANGDFTL
jgi:regulator of nucleoside diphosphate kinase